MTSFLALASAFVAGAVATAAINEPPTTVRLVTVAGAAADSPATARPNDRSGRNQAFADERYVVRPGDSLWGIAARHYDDASAAMETIKRRNGLRRDMLYAGEVLVLPASGRTSAN